MSTLYLTHAACLDHDTGSGHPERPDRLRAVERALEDEKFQPLIREQAQMADGDITVSASSRTMPCSGEALRMASM